MVSIATIARELELSPSAVSHVLNGRYFKVSASTRERIEECLRKHNYRRNGLVSALKSKRTHSLAILVPSMRYSIFSFLLLSMEARAREKGYHLFVVQTHQSPLTLKSEIDHLRERRVDGFCIYTISSARPVFEDIWLSGVPLVLMYSYFEDLDIPYATIDELTAATMAARHLIEQGHRSFLIHVPTIDNRSPVAVLRYKGFMDTLRKAGVTNIIECRDDTGVENGYTSVKNAIDSGKKFTAVLAATDMVAIGAVRAIQHSGLSVPGDIAVMGIGNLEEGRYLTPSLSTIHQWPDKIGVACIDMLIYQIETGMQPKSLKLPPKLLVRGSTVETPPMQGMDWLSWISNP